MKRRALLKNLAWGGLVALTPQIVLAQGDNKFALSNGIQKPLKGNIKHSVCRWTFDHLSVSDLCLLVKQIGFSALDLIEPKDFPILKKHGVHCSMCTGAHISLTEGWNDLKNHPVLIDNYLKHIDWVADAGYQNLICFSGNRNGMSDQEGLENCVIGLKQIMPHAEKRGVVIQMELFNSKVNHPDYMADSSRWGIELCNALGSSHFKLLYDIYHLQIMEGNIIETIQKNHHYFGHYHTAGVPGRHEIDNTQELNYPAIMKAIFKTGYTGYVAQEFIATAKNKTESLAKAIAICDI